MQLSGMYTAHYMERRNNTTHNSKTKRSIQQNYKIIESIIE